jgi:hypothetical protein
MKMLSWVVVTLACLFAVAASVVVAYVPSPYNQSASVFLATLSGGGFSAFFSLFFGRFIQLQSALIQILADIKAWDSKPSAPLAHKVQIALELVRDTGYRADSPIIRAVNPMPGEIRQGCPHRVPADRIYPLLQRSLLKTVLASMFRPDYPHPGK